MSKTIKIQGNDYLKVSGRIDLFRADFPVTGDKIGSIETELVSPSPIIFKAYVAINGVIVATAFASAPEGDTQRANKVKGRLLEAVETAAVGRALARAGYGEEDDEGDFLADAPIERNTKQSAQANNDTTRHVQLLRCKKEIVKGQKGDITKYKFVASYNGDEMVCSCFNWEFKNATGIDDLQDISTYDNDKQVYTLISPMGATVESKGKFWNIVSFDVEF